MEPELTLLGHALVLFGGNRCIEASTNVTITLAPDDARMSELPASFPPPKEDENARDQQQADHTTDNRSSNGTRRRLA